MSRRLYRELTNILNIRHQRDCPTAIAEARLNKIMDRLAISLMIIAVIALNFVILFR